MRMALGMLAATGEPEPEVDITLFAFGPPIIAAIAYAVYRYAVYRKEQSSPPPGSAPSARPGKAPQPSGRNPGSGNRATPNPIEIMSGELFDRAMERGEVPPPGPMFLNRFLHQMPTNWADEWDAVPPGQRTDSSVVADSLDRLITDVLDHVARGGAPLPVLSAAEEALTLNMTALAVQLAPKVRESVPREALADVAREAGGGFPGWTDNPIDDLIALQIREESSSVDAQLLMAGRPRLLDEPGHCARCLRLAMQIAAQQLTQSPGLITERPGGLGVQIRRMNLALKAADNALVSLYPEGWRRSG